MIRKYQLLKVFFLLCCIFLYFSSYAQNVGINTTGATPHTSAGLDVDFPDKGFLLPRMDNAAKMAIQNPATGLMIYQTDIAPGIYFYSGSAWVYNGSGSQWVSVDSNIVYTTSNTGNVGIGTKNFLTEDTEKLLVSVGTEGSINAISARGNNSSYVQINVKNYSNGVGASSDIVATNDTGNEDQGYIDMGINSSNNSAEGTLGGPNKAYLFSTGDDFVIGNGTPDKNLTLYSTNSDEETTEKFRLNSTGVTFSQSLRVVTTNTTINIDDYTLICKNSSVITVTLPDAVDFIGRVFYVRQAGSNSVKVQTVNSQTIDGSNTSQTISKNNGGIMLQSDGSNWYTIISNL